MPRHMLKYVLVRHVPVRHVLGHVNEDMPRHELKHVLRHVPTKHMPEHVPGHMLEHVPQNRKPSPPST